MYHVCFATNNLMQSLSFSIFIRDKYQHIITLEWQKADLFTNWSCIWFE